LYPALASSALSAGPAGSSAGGEQPKFLATVDHGTHAVPVLVKFSPPRVDDVGVRVADLLVSEHVAHEVLAAAGHPTARSTLVWAGDRVFLEVARFDRDGPEHRRGVIPLGAVDGELLVLGLRPAELVGSPLDRWSTTTAALVAQGQLTADDHREVRWREVFGDLVANTDMHANNLSLWLDDLALAGVAPSYDLLPMAYAVRQNELPRVTFAPRVPAPADADVARPAWEAAVTYWAALADHGEVSEAWRAVARDNHRRVAELGPAIGRLPR
ncbi:MAG: HipA domain-containing protein, partial [Myxococcota bacterium]